MRLDALVHQFDFTSFHFWVFFLWWSTPFVSFIDNLDSKFLDWNREPTLLSETLSVHNQRSTLLGQQVRNGFTCLSFRSLRYVAR